MATIQKIQSVTGAGPVVYRKKGYGAGTLGGFDFKNTYCQPLGAATVPDATSLLNLVRSGAVATVSGANAGTAGGGLSLASGKKILLPTTFKIASSATDMLIILWIKHGTQTLASGNATVFGWLTDTGANANHGAYITSANPNNMNFLACGAFLNTLASFVAGTVYQIAIRLSKSGTTMSYELYRNGALSTSGTATVASTYPQPSGTPVIGASTAGSVSGIYIGEAFSHDITDLSADTRTAAGIVLADYNLYSTRFS